MLAIEPGSSSNPGAWPVHNDGNNRSELFNLVAFIVTIAAIMAMVTITVTAGLTGAEYQQVGLGNAITGLIAIASQFRMNRAPVSIDTASVAAVAAAVPSAPAIPLPVPIAIESGSLAPPPADTFTSKLQDYGESLRRAPGCDPMAAGTIAGINDDGEVTDKWSAAHSYVVVSTNAAIVGGVDPKADPRQSEIVAIAGQVPVNIAGGIAGQYVDAIEAANDGIGGRVVAAAGPNTVGRIWRIESDGRAWIKLI